MSKKRFFFAILIGSLLWVTQLSAQSINFPCYCSETASALTDSDVAEMQAQLFYQLEAVKFAAKVTEEILLVPDFSACNAKIDYDNYWAAFVIYYNPCFVQYTRSELGVELADVGWLSHEFGHHFQDVFYPRKIRSKEENWKIELQADSTSGALMAKLYLSLDEALKLMQLIADEEGGDTHPPKHLRLRAIAWGWVLEHLNRIGYFQFLSSTEPKHVVDNFHGHLKYAIGNYIVLGILPSITLGQEIKETGHGRSLLTLHNNFHGIKGEGDAGSILYKGDFYAQNSSPESAYVAHARKLLSRKHFQQLISDGNADYKTWSRALMLPPAYAEDPNYAEDLILLIERLDLKLLDQLITGAN